MRTHHKELSPLEHLRSATRALHERVDQAAAAYPATAEGLQRFLTAIATVVVPLEIALREAGLSPALLKPERWTKCQWLAEDLGMLPAVPEGRIAHLTGARAWGALYVLEGSTLGGPVLARMRWPALPSRYLTGYGVSAREMWAEFGAELDRRVGIESIPAVVEGARSTFEKFEEALRGHV